MKRLIDDDIEFDEATLVGVAESLEPVTPAPDVKARLSIAAGVKLGWKQWVGDEGDSISIEHYGASAPGNTVLEKFGYTVDNVVARARALVTRVA